MDDCGSHFAMHGPYYRSLLTTFQVNLGDTIIFSWDEDDKIFNVFVLASTYAEKFWVGFPHIFY
jgi:hypothetical protein